MLASDSSLLQCTVGLAQDDSQYMLKEAVGPGIGIKTNNSRIKGLVDYINWLPTLSGGCFR